MNRIAVCVLLACTIASAETIVPDILTAPPPAANTKWMIEIVYEKPDVVAPDGRHLGISWTRDKVAAGAVLVVRRTVDDPDLKGTALRVVDRTGPALISAFLYPSDPKTDHPPFDAKSNPLTPGMQLGEWTVVGSVDGDPAEPIVDEVDPSHHYSYALIPAVRGAAPNTYEQFPGDAVTTWAVKPRASWFHHHRWLVYALIGGGGLGIITGFFVARRRRAGAKPISEAS